MKLGFVTCVQLGLSCMEAIYAAGAELDLVVTLPDDVAVQKSGRVSLDDFCGRRGISLLKTRHVNDAVVSEIVTREQIDWLFIIGWSQIAGPDLLRSPTKGVLGIHPTLLPEGRGRAAIPWAIIKGLEQTGVTLFKLDEGVDTGSIVAQRVIPLSSEITATELYAAVNSAHTEVMRDIIPDVLADKVVLHRQDESKATYWPGRTPADGEIDLGGSVHNADRLVRAVTHPYPGAFVIRDGQKTIVWKASISQSQPSEGDNFLGFADGYLIIEAHEIG